MDFNVYQNRAIKTAVYPRNVKVGMVYHPVPVYPALKLAGEAGEVAEKIGKVIRDHKPGQSIPTDALVKELGDVLWYLANIAEDLGVDLDTVAYRNLKKVEGRQERGTLHGSGDDR